jgi:outer membrane receptor protein involved in Fe transport
MNKLTTLLIFSFIYSGVVFAEELVVEDKELQELLSLDLDELATVSVASKKEESVKIAPSIVTVITAEEISRYGARNLRDVLDRQTSIQIIGSNLFPHNRVNMRGVSFTHTDNTTLLLINGRPMRDAGNNSTNTDFYSSFPVNAIKQIEIIRGPGSVLYGTNAFAGVINLITKEAPHAPGAEFSLTYGSFDTKQISVSGGGKWGELEIFTALKAQDVGGDNFNNITDETGTIGTYKTGNSSTQAVLNTKYKGFTLNALLSDTSQDNAKSAFNLPSVDLDIERQYVDLGYKHFLSKDWWLSTNFTYSYFKNKAFANNVLPVTTSDSNDYLFEITTHAKISKKMNFLAGGTFHDINGNGDAFTKSYHTNTLGSYLQLEYQILDWLAIIGGGQYNKPKLSSGNFSPRLSLIAQLNDHWNAKLLYGEAFREPSPVEQFIVLPTLRGKSSLSPESIETFEAQLSYQSKRSSFAATYFHSEQKNLISRTGVTPQTFINAGKIKYNGFELEGKYNFGHGFNFIGNLSYQTNEKNDDTNNVTYSPDWMIKTGLSYESPQGYQFSVFNSYFAQSTLQNHQTTTVNFSNPDAEGYNLLTANLKMNLGDVFNTSQLKNVSLSVYGDNLLDEDIYFPSINRRSVNSISHHAGRGFYGTINISF